MVTVIDSDPDVARYINPPDVCHSGVVIEQKQGKSHMSASHSICSKLSIVRLLLFVVNSGQTYIHFSQRCFFRHQFPLLQQALDFQFAPLTFYSLQQLNVDCYDQYCPSLQETNKSGKAILERHSVRYVLYISLDHQAMQSQEALIYVALA